ncbi:ATPase [Vibrio variabilis]|uniref:ATPase n=1 Tax=Vibrio variabilis TaxID=990271 RepID=A0ABQ0JJG8_9VIBR|nr:ATPase [Vibrio variabilis]
MSIQNYWPERNKVIDCIRSEAEELTDQLLISVHQSMQLSKGLFGHLEGQGESVTENDLLNHLKAVNRPIPLVGNAGSGKSHLVRWVHAKLRLDPEIQNNWHIVRIPKNASLRQVLNLLLDGLEGEEFENARAKVHEVGSSLETDKIATLFVTFTRFALDEVEKKIKKGPRPDSKEKAKELRDKALIAKHLSNYLKDDIIESHLTDKGMPVYNLANRLVSNQQSYQEVDDSQYVIAKEHLEFNYDIDNLGKNARDAVNNLQLHTNPERMQLCLDVLNEAINTSSKDIFSQLFQFNNGSFQDLFKDIRRSLKSKSKTLVVLVEDMAAISAIEDVLLDSLLEEDTYEGESDLCLLKSIVAVTHNYPGYLYRGATLVTRSNFEWKIRTDESSENYERVIDFCSRYINAARHGKQEIQNLWKASKGFEALPVWDEYLEGDELDTLGAYGKSSIGIPLFPYNRASIIKLTKTYCMSLGKIDFNPRKIINNILLPLLRDHQQDFVRGLFPSATFAPEVSTEGAMGVISEINRLGLNADEKARANKFAVIWGQGRTLDELKKTVNNLQAKVFSLPEIFGSGTVIYNTEGGKDKVEKPKYCSECGELVDSCVCQTNHDTPELELFKREQEIDDWFSHKQALPQETANELRRQLFDMLSNYRDLDWYGVDSTKQWKTPSQRGKSGGGSLFDVMVKIRNTYLIELPRTGANRWEPFYLSVKRKRSVTRRNPLN